MSTKKYQFLGSVVTRTQLEEVLKGYLSTDENSDIISWIEPIETGLRIHAKDGKTEDVAISQAKEFETVEYDKETHYLHFYDIDRNDVIDPVYIEGGGGGTASSSNVKLTNQNGTATFAVAPGTSLNLMFNFTSTEDDVATGDGSCQISVNGTVKSTFSIKQGLTTVDVSPYLSSGSNTVRVRCTDVYGEYKTLVYTISVIDMYITSLFDASAPYSGAITYKYTPYGAIEKTIHILVDGTEVSSTVTSTSGKQATYTISALPHGVHRLEVYATAEIDDMPMESEHLVYDVMCTETSNTSAMIASAYEIKSIKQGELVSAPYIVYDPTKLACDISLDIYTMSSGSEVMYSTQSLTVDRSQQYWNTRKYPVGTVYFRIKYGSINKIHIIEVTESDIQVDPIANDLELELLSEGRSNSEANPAVWSYGNVTTAFSGINWDSTGWITDNEGDTCLRLNGDARAEVKFQPFSGDIREYGKTIELEFAIRDVNSRDATVISCHSGGIGFEVKADKAYIDSEQSNIFCKYKDEEKVKLAFVVESKNEYRILSIYLNGICSDTIQYPDNDSFKQISPVNITIGSSECGIDLYSIRSYSTALTHQGSVNNFIADLDDLIEKTEAFERNDIYDEYGNISFEKCKEKNSVMIIIGELPTAKGDKKNVKVIYYDHEDQSLNFADVLVVIDVQGTSSQWYIRKNWKLKCSEEHAIAIDQVLNKVFCIKVDYAEATGTHNTGNAVFVETLYSEPIPPQEANPLTRTTIYGKPILLFHQADENSDPVFYGKANFNFDKGSLEAFGFTSDYDVECWEFCNNTSDACNFLGPVPSIWVDDFEARYPEDYTDISRFKIMHDWVVSTNQNGATGSALSETYTDLNGKTYNIDTAEYRLAKFKTEFEDHFNMHYSLIYYVYTFFALMVDQRAKNMFLTYWASTGRWYPYFYDNDTSFGIDNEGRLTFDYYHEDTDTINDANVYNGQNSVLWTNFREAFPDKIEETYYSLRSSGRLTYDKLVNQFITNGSDKWSESIYNEDSDFKYVSMLRTDNDASNLTQLRGSGEEHFRYFVENRIMYCDSKWQAPDYENDYIRLRVYTPDTWAGIEPNADVTATYFSTMYGAIKYKANGTIQKEKVQAGVPVTFEAPNETFNNTETSVFGASQLSSLGDLAPLYCGGIVVDKANKLIELKIGDSTEGYTNDNLVELSVGTNTLLKRINICNCPKLVQAVDLSGCPNIEKVYATGSGISAINLTSGGSLKIAQLPASVVNITLIDQLYIEEFTLESYENVTTLRIENCPTIDEYELLEACTNLTKLRFTDVNWSFDDASTMLALADKNLAGIDENGKDIDYMWIDGKCHIGMLSGDEYLAIKEAFPYMTITYDTLTSQLIFMSEDGTTELARQTVQNGGDGSYTGTTPTKASTAQYTYTFAGWSLTPGGSADANAIKGVEADRIVYAAFSSTLRTYTVKFYNGTTLLQTVSDVPYGSTATYTGSTPTNDSTGNTADFEFSGWKPSPTNIQGDTSCYAQFYDLREITDDWATIAANCAAGTGITKYAIGAYKTLDITYEDGTSESIPMRVVAHNHDELPDGAVKWESLGTLPYPFYKGGAVVYNDELHILGSDNSTLHNKYHRKWNGTEWASVSTLPYNFYSGSAVVYNNELHILGGYGDETAHYKWNGTEWTSVSTLPYSFYQGSAVVYNDELHILGGNAGNTNHYKWNGTEWASVSTLPYNFYLGSAVVYNNELHILGGYGDETAHYKWNGTEWTSVSTLPYSFYQGFAVVYNDELHILGGDRGNVGTTTHYKYDGSTWTSVSTLPYTFYNGSAVVYNNSIVMLGSAVSSNKSKFFKMRGTEWEKVDVLSSINNAVFSRGVCVYKDKIHILGTNSAKTTHYVYDGENVSALDLTLPIDLRNGCPVVYNDELHVLYNTAHYKYDGSTWSEIGTLPDSALNAVIYNDEIHMISSSMHYKYDGSTWVEVGSKPNININIMCIYNGNIIVFGGYNTSQIYQYDGSSWSFMINTPYKGSLTFGYVQDGVLHFLGGRAPSTTDGSYLHYVLIDNEWVLLERMNLAITDGYFVLYKGHAYYFAYKFAYILKNPTADLTFIADNLLSETQKFNASVKYLEDYGWNRGGYLNSDLYVYITDTLYNSLSDELKNVITEVVKYSDTGQPAMELTHSNEKIWTCSFEEVGCETTLSAFGQGETYPVFSDNNSRIRRSMDETIDIYWLRSTINNNKIPFIGGDGTFQSDSGNSSKGVLIGFCI